MRKILLLFSLVCVISLFTPTVFATDVISKYPTATVINPIRGPQLGLEKVDLLESLKGQWRVTKQYNIPATWLWQYSAMEDKKLIAYAKQEMKNQEFGLFLEIDKNTAEKVGIKYRGKGPWYHSDGLFLVSYDQYERRKIIDAFFTKFREQFGYYPKSVGAWWVGADAIEYMRQKYGIVAVLQCADQYGTDGYSLWGFPWSISYIPSKQNAAIPAQNFGDQQNNVVMMQWAPRDPVRGYGPTIKASLYSVQDMQIPEIGYYGYLVDIYLNQPFDHTIVGLEGGLPPETYTTRYASQLKYLQQIQNEKKITIQPASVFAQSYLQRGDTFPPTRYFLTKDYENNDQSFWYHSSAYRAGIQKRDDKIYLVDFRDYTKTSAEDFSVLPNTNKKLYIHTKAIIDTMHSPQQQVLLATSDKPLSLKQEGNTVNVLSGGKEIAKFTEHSMHTTTFPQFSLKQSPWMLVVVLIGGYCLLLLIFAKTKKGLVLTFASLGILLCAFYPIYSNGLTNADAYMFDKKFLWMLALGQYVPVTPQLKIMILYQILPMLFIFAIHFILRRKVTNNYIFLACIVGIYMLVFSYNAQLFQQFLSLFQQGKKIMLIGIVVTACFMGLLFILKKLLKKKHYKMAFIIVGIIVGIIFVTQYKNVYTEKRLVITSFEMEALNAVAAAGKNVTYLSMKPHPDIVRYETIKPLIYTDDQIAKWLTGVNWQKVEIEEGKNVQLDKKENSLIMVPIYQEAFIYESDIQKYSLKKVFDNILISMYEI